MGEHVIRIVILNNNAEAADYGQHHRQNDDIILSIGPAVRHYALENNWEIRTLASLWSKEEYFKAKDESELRIKTLVKELNDYSKSVANFFPLTVGDYFHFQLQMNIGIIHYNSFILNSIQRVSKVETIVLYNYKRPVSLIENFWIDCDHLLAELANNLSDQKFVLLNSCRLKAEKSENKNINIKSLLRKILPEQAIISIMTIRGIISNNNFSFLGNRIKLLSVGALYDWKPLFSNSAFKNKYRVTCLPNMTKFPDQVDNGTVLSLINKSIELDGRPVVDFSYQSSQIASAIKFFDRSYHKTVSYLKKYSGLLTTVHMYPRGNYLCHLANILNISVVNWQHGEMNIYSTPFLESLETRYTNHYFAFGKDVASAYEALIGKSAIKKVYIAGSTKKSITRKGSELIIYPTGKWLANSIPFIDAIDPDTRLYNVQNKILRYLESIGTQHKVVLKANTPPYIFAYHPKNVMIEYKRPFTELLKNAKLVILDAPATTCIESVSTDVPLFILTGRSPWNEKPMRLLKKRAVVEDTPEALIKRINQYLANGDYQADLHNTEFLEGWGSVCDPEEAQYNALNFIKQIVNENKRTYSE